jgi:hypothetical protein
MMKPFDIGLIGLAGSGKDTVADIICDELNYKRASFAASLKNLCFSMGWNGHKDARGRKLLQDVGMAFREYDKDIWVDKTASSLINSHKYVFTDVRFSNEAHYIKNARNGIIIRVIRPNLQLSPTHQHVSESGQKEIEVDYTIMNHGTLDDLKVLVMCLMMKISEENGELNELTSCRQPIKTLP